MSIPAGKWSLVLCCLVFQAGLSRVSGQEPFFKAHPVTSEINNSVLQTILHGSNGFIWLGTSEGIYRFDGINSPLVPSADTLANASITALYESEDGTLWAGTH